MNQPATPTFMIKQQYDDAAMQNPDIKKNLERQ